MVLKNICALPAVICHQVKKCCIKTGGPVRAVLVNKNQDKIPDNRTQVNSDNWCVACVPGDSCTRNEPLKRTFIITPSLNQLGLYVSRMRGGGYINGQEQSLNQVRGKRTLALRVIFPAKLWRWPRWSNCHLARWAEGVCRKGGVLVIVFDRSTSFVIL